MVEHVLVQPDPVDWSEGFSELLTLGGGNVVKVETHFSQGTIPVTTLSPDRAGHSRVACHLLPLFMQIYTSCMYLARAMQFGALCLHLKIAS